jgi:NADH dehydrogenase
MTMILIAGSTGLLGAEIGRRLAEKGKDVRALVRTASDAARRAQLNEWGCELFEGDLKNADSLTAACRGVQTVISTVSSTFSRREGDSIQSVDRDGQLRLVDAAVRAGVRQWYLPFISNFNNMATKPKTAKNRPKKRKSWSPFTTRWRAMKKNTRHNNAFSCSC